jgi:hypothetical protein
VPRLLGEGVELETLNGIVSIIKQNPYVKEVKAEKAVIIGT